MFDQVAMDEYLWKCDWIFGYQMCGQKLQVIKEGSFYIREALRDVHGSDKHYRVDCQKLVKSVRRRWKINNAKGLPQPFGGKGIYIKKKEVAHVRILNN